MEFNFNKLKATILPQASVWIKKILWNLGNHAFLVILALILLEVLFGGLMFYKYVFLADAQAPQASSNSFQFAEGVYQNILSQWQKRSQNFQDYSQKNYQSPF